MNRHWMAIQRTLLALVAIGAGVQSSAQGEGATVDALVSKYAQPGQFNGTVLVAREGRALLEKGYGMACFENSVPSVQVLQKMRRTAPPRQALRFVLDSLCTL